MELRTADFDFFLPEALIAQEPARPRDAARLLVVDDALRDMAVRDLPALLQPGDLMVVNDTRVIPARLVAFRGEARIEVMLNRAEGGGRVACVAAQFSPAAGRGCFGYSRQRSDRAGAGGAGGWRGAA